MGQDPGRSWSRTIRSHFGLSDAPSGDVALPTEGRRDPSLPAETKRPNVREAFSKAAEGYKALQKIGKPAKSLSTPRSTSKK